MTLTTAGEPLSDRALSGSSPGATANADTCFLGAHGFLDAHCHLDDPRLDAVRDAWLEEARAAGIGGWVLGGVDPDQWPAALRLAAEVPGVVATLGVHPWAASRMAPDALDAAYEQLSVLPLSGLGELGLDGSKYVPRGSLPAQGHAFRAQLSIARERNVPIVLHILAAHGEALSVLERDGVPRRGGLVHSYSGPAELVSRYEALGLCISFSASITRPTANKALQAAARVSPDRLLVETDSPDQVPSGRDGALNRPAWLHDVARAVGAARGESPEHVLTRSSASLRRLFALDVGRTDL
jgi:TatD DNase family protein